MPEFADLVVAFGLRPIRLIASEKPRSSNYAG
jgi:hypothetical protein